MKRMTLLLLSTIFVFPFLNAQNEKKNTVYVIGAPSLVHYGTRSEIDGGGDYDGKMGYALGLEYSRELFKNFEVLSGIHYSSNKINSKSSASLGPEFPVTKGSFKINYVSIPIQVKYSFCNYFFVNGGTILNFDKGEKYSSTKDKLESTINGKFGLLVGIGAKFDFKENYCVIINPYFQTNDLSSDRHENFYNIGVKLGVGYKF